jgi:type IV pilus assembly protein PilA
LLNLTKLRERRASGESGFTLIELLVVVVIMGILIAIAIPVYLNYKKGASDKSAQSDLRNAINVFEQCNVDNSVYPSAVGGTGALTGCTGQSVKASSGTTFVYFAKSTPAASANTNYIVGAYNTNGSGSTTNYFCYASAAGGSISTKTTALAAYADAC